MIKRKHWVSDFNKTFKFDDAFFQQIKMVQNNPKSCFESIQFDVSVKQFSSRVSTKQMRKNEIGFFSGNC